METPNKNVLGDGLYKLEASDQIPIVQSVIVFRNKYCLHQECIIATCLNNIVKRHNVIQDVK